MNSLHVLADNNFGDTSAGAMAGPMGLFIVVLLGIATFLLIRNMNKRIKRLPESFPPPGEPRETSASDSTGSER
jgi:hypothetical protein